VTTGPVAGNKENDGDQVYVLAPLAMSTVDCPEQMGPPGPLAVTEGAGAIVI
jgi:hypothetical protein